ncbi:discoidin domain-containing protein [Paenibacillus sp. NPDC056579]|uniref:discoidin domain-containing protein n=1 Tax=Paenibacillus sp. NPDC056579 TaxID=3345871 RepID=UPI0036793E78
MLKKHRTVVAAMIVAFQFSQLNGLSSYALAEMGAVTDSGGAASSATIGSQNIAAAAAVQHPYFPPSATELQTAIANADKLLAQYTDEQWLRLVPQQSPRTVLNDPFDGSDGWVWSPANPDQIQTKKGLVFPNNSQYPYQYESVKVMSGKTVSVPYVLYNGKKYLIQARIDYEKTQFMSDNLPVLANAYLATGDEKYARRAAIALDAWATAVPDFYMTKKNGASFISADDVDDYYNTDIQRVSDHNGIAHEMHTGEIYAFDRIFNSAALQELSQSKGYDVREHITNDFFLNVVNWLTTYQSMKVHTSTNLSGAVEAISRVATVLHRPELLEWLGKYMDITVGDNFKRDGMFPESFSYHAGYANSNYTISQLIKTYFQIHSPETEAEQKLKEKIDRQSAFLASAKEAQKKVAFPDGDLPPFDDTTKGGASKRNSTTSQLLPAYGHLMLGDGDGRLQTQYNLHFNDYANHVHPNVLSSTLFGFGKELLGGIRYSRNAARDFTSETLATNNVVVNKKNQFRSTKQGAGNPGHLFTNGNLSLYEPGIDGIAASEVYSNWAYPGTTQRYQRLNVMNTIDAEHPYVIDLFKVTGGSTHEYFLHGSTQFDETAEASFPLQKIDKPYPLLPDNVTWTDPVKEGDSRNWYGMFRDMSTGQSPGNWDVTFRDAEDGGLGTRIFMVDDGSNQVYLGKSPHSFRDKVYDNIYEFWRPSLIVKREAPGESNLDSLFISVMEPLNGDSAIASVSRVPLQQANPEHVALSVKFKNGREDVVLVNMNNEAITGSTAADQPFATADGKYSLNGRIGVHYDRHGFTKPYLINGSGFQSGGESLTIGTSSYTGTITGAVRRADGSDVDALITDANLPEGSALKGKWMSLQFGAYKVIPDSNGAYPNGVSEQNGFREMFQIERVEKRNGLTYIITSEDHTLSIGDNTSEALRPQRTFEGKPAMRIDFSATTSAVPPVFVSPKLEGIQVDGKAVSGFDPAVYSYKASLPEGTATIPVVTATGSNLIEVTQAQEPFGTAYITVKDPQDPTLENRYSVRFTPIPVYGDIPNGLVPFQITGVTASPGYNSGFPPPNAIDGNLATRYAAKGEHWIQFDLGESKWVDSFIGAFLNGDKNKYFFDLELSENGTDWKKVYAGSSNGKTAGLELFSFEKTKARYVKFNGHGNTADTWNNINEVYIGGYAAATKLDLSVSNAVYSYSDSVQLRTILTSVYGLPLPGQTIQFSLNDTSIGEAVTGPSGEAVLNYRVNAGVPSGNSAEYGLKAQYAGSSDQIWQPSAAQSKLTVQKEEASLVFVGSLNSDRSNVTISALVKQQDDGEPGALNDLPVTFDLKRILADGTYEPVRSATVSTSVYGQADLPAALPAGLYEVKASLGSNPYYKDIAGAATAIMTVNAATYGSLQVNGHTDVPDPSGIFGDRTKQIHMEGSWERRGDNVSGTLRIHAEPQGLRLTMNGADWLATTASGGYVQGKAVDDKGAAYTVRLMLETSRVKRGHSSDITIVIWRGNSAAGTPAAEIYSADFKGSINIR